MSGSLAGRQMEAARILGFGCRMVSGYLYDPDITSVGWAEIYVPGAGWITFDPTNRGVGGHNLIPVAVARDIRQRNIGFFSLIAASLLAAALLVSLLVGGEISGPKVAFIGAPPITTR
jgi:hypothetical protein